MRPLRVVVWATGWIGRIAIEAIQRRSDLELVGVWVHSAEKDGADAGELARIGPIGVLATTDADALIALAPDCVLYAASGPERDAAAIPDYLRLLDAGINLVSVSTPSLIFPPAYEARRRRNSPTLRREAVPRSTPPASSRGSPAITSRSRW